MHKIKMKMIPGTQVQWLLSDKLLKNIMNIRHTNLEQIIIVNMAEGAILGEMFIFLNHVYI